MLGKVNKWAEGRRDLAADMSERSGALAASEARFRAIFEHAAVGMARAAPDGRWLEVNDRLCQITGYTRDELLTRRVQDIMHPDDLTEGAQQLRRVLAGELASCERHKRYVRKDGSLVWVACTAALVRRPDGQPDFFIKTVEDITRAKEAELALETSNRLLDAVIEHLPAIVFLKRASDLRYVRVNRAGEELLGYPPGYFVGKSVYDLLPGDQADFFTAADREVLASGEARRIREVPWQTPANGTLYFRTSKSLLRDTNGTPTHLLGVALDITERKQAEEHVKLLLRELNHRAKNLLTVVQALARHTANEVAPEVFAERFGERLAGLAASHDLLVKSDWKGVDIADLVRSQLAHLGDLVGTRVAFDGPPLRLSTSAAQAIGMALHELATNAVKYGALSDDAGVVRIAWEKYANGGAPQVRLMWSEHDGPLTQPPSRRGFGHTVMVGIIELELGADVHLTYAPSGVLWEMTGPAERVMEEVKV
jgi:PAS domain S-box-containing protein